MPPTPRRMGAEGIGLCRTEHMFLAAERLPLVRRLILTDDPDVEQDALADLEHAQQIDFEGILAEMAGLPVTIRLLDPPLHEFLPDFLQLMTAETRGQLDDEGHLELAAVRRLHEVNPMIGTRGVRLGVVRPGLYQMQVRALLRAITTASELGHRPNVEVMIPLVVDPSEMRLARQWVADAARDVSFGGHVAVGAMLETPRAALLAGELAEVSDFFSFGTNDLTQLIFGFSRDDVGTKLIPTYLRSGLLDHDPFESLDPVGVGRIIQYACENARATNPTMRIGVCGEQAGDPESAKMLVTYGVDYVSCSPYRVPVARLGCRPGTARERSHRSRRTVRASAARGPRRGATVPEAPRHPTAQTVHRGHGAHAGRGRVPRTARPSHQGIRRSRGARRHRRSASTPSNPSCRLTLKPACAVTWRRAVCGNSRPPAASTIWRCVPNALGAGRGAAPPLRAVPRAQRGVQGSVQPLADARGRTQRPQRRRVRPGAGGGTSATPSRSNASPPWLRRSARPLRDLPTPVGATR